MNVMINLLTWREVGSNRLRHFVKVNINWPHFPYYWGALSIILPCRLSISGDGAAVSSPAGDIDILASVLHRR